MKARTRGRTEKDRALTRHVKRRFAERFGMYANRSFRLEVLRMIWGHRSRLIERQSLTRSIHRVTVGGLTVDVVYDKARHKLVTCLYPPRPEEEGDRA